MKGAGRHSPIAAWLPPIFTWVGLGLSSRAFPRFDADFARVTV
jgi:hypothetical protein